MQNASTNLHQCVFEINMMGEFEDGCGPSKGTGGRMVGSWSRLPDSSGCKE